MIAWVSTAWATCTAGWCEVDRVDASCAPIAGPATAGEPLYLTALCVESVCCAGSAESCTTTYASWSEALWRQDGPVWVRTGQPVVGAGSCGEVPRYSVVVPGGTVRIGPVVVEVAGELEKTGTPWPPGFPDLADGLHARVPAAEGTASVVVDDLPAALRAAGWALDPSGLWTARDGVLVRLAYGALAWRTQKVPIGAWWTGADPCRGDAQPIERERAPGAPEHVCVRPDGVLDGPYTAEWPGGGSRGWYADGELDGDWLDLGPANVALRSYVHGEPVGHWEIVQGGAVQSDGWYADGAKDGAWTMVEPGGVTEVATYCGGSRCGAYTRTRPSWVERGAYDRGAKVGRWETTYAGGVVQEGDWVDGHPVGVHRRTFETGVPAAIEVYGPDGRPDGIWLQYDADGAVVRRDRYREGELVRSRTWTDGHRDRRRY